MCHTTAWTDALPTHMYHHVYDPGTTQRGLRGARGARLVPEPQRTSARWHSLSPGSLHRSTTSRHVVSGVTGTSVKCCSLSLRNTVRNICQERDSSCQRPFLSPESPSKCVCAGSHPPPPTPVPPTPPAAHSLQSPWGPWHSVKPAHAKGQTESFCDAVCHLFIIDSYGSWCVPHPSWKQSYPPIPRAAGPPHVRRLFGGRPRT